MNISAMSLGRKITLGSIVLAVFSLFLPWVDLGFLGSANGFNQDGYLFLIAYIYPVYCIIKKVHMNKVFGVICGLAAVVASIFYMMSKIDLDWGLNLNGTGIYVFLVSAILLTISALMKNE